MGPVARSVRRGAGLVALTVMVGVIVVPAAWGSTPFSVIHSPGALSDIYIGNDLSCQVRSGGFSSTEYFPNASGPGDCGTFLFTGSDNATEELLGPDFADHTSTNTTGHFPIPETPYTPVRQSMAGSGTAGDPYEVTTVVTANDPQTSGGGTIVFQITEVDSYVVGQDSYRSDVTVKNVGNAAMDAVGQLYHATDCQLRGSDTGFGASEPPQSPNTAACTVTILNNPASARAEFDPIGGGANWIESTSSSVWGDLDTTFPDGCGSCRTNVDNGTGIEWPVAGLGIGSSDTFSFLTTVVDTTPTGGFSLTGSTGGTTTGTLATIADPDPSSTTSAYSATINWGDGSSSAGAITGGNGTFDVAGSHSYATMGTYPVAVTITSAGTSLGSSTVDDTATITLVPTSVATGTPPSIGATTAAFTGSINPGGLATTAYFRYALDPKYTGGGPLVYTNATPAQSVGSDFASHTIAASVAGLVPNAIYHVQLVASNTAGTTFGPDVTFTTLKTPPPTTPTLGATFNIAPVSGVVLIELHGQLIPLTELQQIPKNTLIDALHGTLQLITAGVGGGPAHDAAAKKGKKAKTQTGRFGGAIFKLSQATRGAGKGLVTLRLVEGGVAGAPTYAKCKVHKAADATIASSKTLQLLHASAHGKFRTSGRYSAATVRGTIWTVADRCDGTLTRDITHSVAVFDFVHHKTIILHAGQSYLAHKP